ncbi:MAG: 50S ribosomal protein L25, partial [Actinomycetota bacterium]
MAATVVKATLGRDLGSRPSRRLRAEGRLPGVVYGLGKDPQTVAVDYTELRNALNVPTGMNTVFTLEIDGAPETVLVRAVQRDPIKRVVTHADFLRVDPDRTVRVKVPINLIGDASAVTEAGGMIEQKMFEIEVEVAPDAIPEQIDGNLSIMTLDRRLAVGDLSFPASVTPMTPENISVVAPVIPRSAKVAANEAAEGMEMFSGVIGVTDAGNDRSPTARRRSRVMID